MKLESTLVWKKEADTWILHLGEDRLITMEKSMRGVRPFHLEERSFKLIEPRGWSNTWRIQNDSDELILQLQYGFWRANGRVHFRDETKFECIRKNGKQSEFVFKEMKYGDKIISYNIAKGDLTERQPVITVHKNELYTDKLFLLLSLGMGQILSKVEEKAGLNTLLSFTFN